MMDEHGRGKRWPEQVLGFPMEQTDAWMHACRRPAVISLARNHQTGQFMLITRLHTYCGTKVASESMVSSGGNMHTV